MGRQDETESSRWSGWSDDHLSQFISRFCTTRARQLWHHPEIDDLVSPKSAQNLDGSESARAAILLSIVEAFGQKVCGLSKMKRAEFSRQLTKSMPKQKGTSLDADSPVSRYDPEGVFVGSVLNAKPRLKENYAQLRPILRHMLGMMLCAKYRDDADALASRELTDGQSGSGFNRIRLTQHIVDYFFSTESRWFAADRAHSAGPSDLHEASFEIRWLIHHVKLRGLSSTGRPSIVFVSGGSRFLQVNDDSTLSSTGSATVDALKSGIQVIFLFPGGESDARHAVSTFESAVKNATASTNSTQHGECLLPIEVPPTLSLVKSKWSGRWLNPLVRFTFIDMTTNDEKPAVQGSEGLLWMSWWKTSSNSSRVPLAIPVEETDARSDFALWYREVIAEMKLAHPSHQESSGRDCG